MMMRRNVIKEEACRTTLLTRAEECREALRNARQDIRVETAAEAMNSMLLATKREAAVERADNLYRLLRQIEAALFRMKRGRYGLCLKCEDEIESKRLQALPWAIFCLHCQPGVDLLHASARALRNDMRRAA